jgi:murein DD-endopeptidase MepM/ murein hydrolase activator NlpD
VSISSLVRRGLLTIVAVTATIAAVPAQAYAAPENAVHQEPSTRETKLQMKLAMSVARRAQTLADLNRRAEARDRAIAGERAVLARYGYTGDPEAVEVVLPLASYDISAEFGLTGPHWESTHGGQDFSAASGETLVAVADATVTEVADAGPYGLRTILTLGDGTEIWYCHQTSASVTPGETVEIAQTIGAVGSTGNSTGPHLHLEVRPDGGDPVDPIAFFEAAGINP